MNQHQHHDVVQAGPSFFELWSPEYMLFSVALVAIYLAVTGPYRHRFGVTEEVPMGKKITFVMAMVIFYLAMGSPLAYYGHHYLFSAHMLQQSLVYLIVPPLVLVGTPAWFYRGLLNNEKALRFFKRVTNPIFSLVTFNFLFSLYHYPIIFDTMYSIHGLHNVYHGILLLAAFQMWWNVACPVPEMERLTHVRKMGYIFANGVLLTPACGLIIFASDVMYQVYQGVPQVFAALPILDDQQLGGVIMKLVQELAYGFTLWYVFLGWYRNENPTTAADEIDAIEPFETLDSSSDRMIPAK
ncbi:cytochrome c oxidase assembly protein [Brevibacillus dissolubilis]|uniref:cytochrome c oxidase assembly protein n=1 Tax=Brevibacillus dissolubilis TaxID=1844116 RepID=UPI0011167B88|nr:cytochrome c oxidase assembly protein [Brevibacillus dissolubilis]